MSLPGILAAALLLALGGGLAAPAWAAAEEEAPRDIVYRPTPPAPRAQLPAEADAKSAGCISCHTATDQPTMHANPAVVLGCVDCHGGDAAVQAPPGLARRRSGLPRARSSRRTCCRACRRAGTIPTAPIRSSPTRCSTGKAPSTSASSIPATCASRARPAAPAICRSSRPPSAACMATGAMLWGGASYNNGILPFKRYILGEAYTRDGQPAMLETPVDGRPRSMKRAACCRGSCRCRPGRRCRPPTPSASSSAAGATSSASSPRSGCPTCSGQIQRLDEPGRPDIRQSNRGAGHRPAHLDPGPQHHQDAPQRPAPVVPRHQRPAGRLPLLGLQRLPRRLRQRPRPAPLRARTPQFGHHGHLAAGRPDDPQGRAGPSAPARVHARDPDQPVHDLPHAPAEHVREHLPRLHDVGLRVRRAADVAGGAAATRPLARGARDPRPQSRGGGGPRQAGATSTSSARSGPTLNPKAKHTQFADYHGHGWNFRAVFKRDRKGNLLDDDGTHRARRRRPTSSSKAVHLSSIHVDKGMHCVDCHFAQDAHGNGHDLRRGRRRDRDRLPGLPRHRRQAYPTLRTSGPAAPPQAARPQPAAHPGRPPALRVARRQALSSARCSTRQLEWEVTLVKDTVDPATPDYNAKAARAKLMSEGTALDWGAGVPEDQLAHADDKMACYTCHTSWTTSCGGCHLPIEANWKTERHHYEGGEHAQLRDLQPAGRARRDVPARPARRGQGQHHRAGALVLGAGAVVDQRQPRAHLHPAAADLGVGLLEPGVRAALPAHRAQDRDQDLHRLPPVGRRTTTTRSWRSCCCTGPTSSTSSASTPGSAARRRRGGAGDRVGRAAGGDRQLPAPLRLSRTTTPRTSTRGRELQPMLAARGNTQRGGVTRCLQLRGEYLLAAEGEGGMTRLRRRQHRQQGLLASASSPRRSRRSARACTSARPTRPASRCRPTSRSIPTATRAS